MTQPVPARRHLIPFLCLALLVGCMAQGPEAGAPPSKVSNAVSDPFIWLEGVEDPKALDFVRAENARTAKILESDPAFETRRQTALSLLEAKDRIAMPAFRMGQVANFWQDEKNVRGLLRTSPLQDYLAGSPRWKTVLDIDALAKAEGANWVYKGAFRRLPDERFGLIGLSDGGKDATAWREFDFERAAFVPNGFSLPAGKQDFAWLDADRMLVSRDWGPGSTTTSGYPFIVKLWTRGQPLDQAVELYRGHASDVSVQAVALYDPGKEPLVLIDRSVTFFESDLYVVTGRSVQKLNLPQRFAIEGLTGGQLILSLREAWEAGGQKFASGSLIAIDRALIEKSPGALAAELILAPGPTQALQNVETDQQGLYAVMLDNVAGKALRITRDQKGAWRQKPLALPENVAISLVSSDQKTGAAFFQVAGFLDPDSLWHADAKGKLTKIASLPPRFDSAGLKVEQHWAVSKDGTRVPYFLVSRMDLTHDGKAPVLMGAYGGFNVPRLPNYSPVLGKLWLEAGGTYVLANIRGGGEFGPAWHQAGLKGNRQRIYDDFFAVAEDLIKRRITSPQRLGIVGGSNGGLLMGVALTQRPELFKAVVIQVPLLDMLRYHLLPPGASWIGEYGDPENPAEREFLARISPYQNLAPGKTYPEPLFVTSTKDDRVQPGHARKMAALMQSRGLGFYYYENIDGGHSAAANLKESALQAAVTYSYLWRKLGTTGP